MNVRCSIKAIISIVIVFLCLFTSIQLCFGVSETRYMRGDTHTINGLLAYALNTTQSNTAKNVKKSSGLLKDAYWGIRVYKRDSGGSETEITSGTPVAEVIRSAAGQGIQSNTWDCPETALDSTDAIIVKVYHKWTAESWVLIDTFITPQLGAETLDSSTWTVYYWTKKAFVGFPIPRGVDSWFYWGTSTYDSRITGFDWTEATAKEWHNITLWTFNLTAMQWHAVVTWTFNISAMQWIAVSTWIFNISALQWLDIALWTFDLVGQSWHTISTWILNLSTQSWQDIASWVFDLGSKTWRDIATWIFDYLVEAVDLPGGHAPPIIPFIPITPDPRLFRTRLAFLIICIVAGIGYYEHERRKRKKKRKLRKIRKQMGRKVFD